MRAKKGWARNRAKKRLFKKVEGFVGGRRRLLKSAKETLLRAGMFSFRDRRAKTCEQTLAGLRRRHASRAAGQQLDAQPLLEAAHRVAQRRRRYAKSRGGSREAAFFSDDGECRQAAPVFSVHS